MKSKLKPISASCLLWLSGLLLSGLLPVTASAQATDLTRLASWVALDAPTGHEQIGLDSLQAQFPAWQRDGYGNLVRTIGSGSPHRVVACGIDAYSYAITQITDDGYLRLHRVGNGSGHPLWDQSHEGQQLRILTGDGPLVGVTAVANGHFAIQHRAETALVTQNDLWLDVGAESAAAVAGMGINLLDPVLRQLPAWSYGSEVAGPRSGARIGCAAVLAAAEAGINGAGSTSYVISVQQVFGWIGLGAALSRLPLADALIVLGPGELSGRDALIQSLGTRLEPVLANRVTGTVRMLVPEVADADALMERVELDAANNLLRALVEAITPNTGELPAWQSAPAPAPVLNNVASRWGAGQDNIEDLMAIAEVLDQVAEQSAVPGHEGPIRSIIYNALPDWAQALAQVDDMGNLWVEFGPETGAAAEVTVFIAHMDEVGYEIASIDAAGVVDLTRLGGVVTTAWEGQPALLQLDPFSNRESSPDAAQLRGVFLTRSDPVSKQPDTVRAWFGMNAEQLSDAGVQVGMGITGYKEGHRMGGFRYASRSLDDRVGTTALLRAIQGMEPGSVSSRVIFAWSVREEGGLRGAAALAELFWERTRRVYSIDTFVTSDTPLESAHFAFTPLGDGPVLRAIESAAMSTPAELQRNRAIAADAGISVQIGLTQGGTDGSTFTAYGSPNAGISWPGRYSHSPAEIADLRDVAGLIDLIQALARAPLQAQ